MSKNAMYISLAVFFFFVGYGLSLFLDRSTPSPLLPGAVQASEESAVMRAAEQGDAKAQAFLAIMYYL